MTAIADLKPLEERKLEVNVNGIKRLMPALHAANLGSIHVFSYHCTDKEQTKLISE